MTNNVEGSIFATILLC